MARPSLQAVGQNALASFQRMTGPQRVTLGLAFAATAIGIFLVARATSSVPMSTLYADLDPDVASEVTAALDARGVPYELEAGGRVIQVPASDVHQIRLDLAGQDLPGGSGGWEIIDNQSITASAFVEEVGYQRAMQDELARTISSIDNVRAANVHLVMPAKDLFAGDDQHASASILVDTGGQSLSAMQVQAVINLVASAVEGLRADDVALVDETGRVLAAPGGGGGSVDLISDGQNRSRLEYERMLENRIEELLAKVVGPGLADVVVTAELDFDAVTTTTEERRPLEDADGQQRVVNETTRNEFIRDDAAATEEGGELAIELPGDVITDGTGQIDAGVKQVLDERDAVFAFDTVVTTSQNSPGSVTSLSVAVLLDEAQVDAARLGELETMVQAGIGFNENRGDSVAVTLLPFDEDVKAAIVDAQVEPEVTGGGLDLVALLRTVGTVLVALVILLLAIRNLSRNPRRHVIESVQLNELEGGTAAALEAGSTDDEDDGGEPPERRLQHLIANQTDDVAGVLRSWLNENEEVMS